MPFEPGGVENAFMEEIVPGTYDIKFPLSVIAELIRLAQKDPNALSEIISDPVMILQRLGAYKDKKKEVLNRQRNSDVLAMDIDQLRKEVVRLRQELAIRPN